MSTALSNAAATGLESPAAEGLPLVLPPHLTANFEKADRQLMESYGSSPGVTALVRLWVACGTSREIQREFERAVLDIRRKTLNPPESGEFDEDCL
ncbi:MAG: hypothetical protein PHQ04_04410 [Opitutaceae bacterium]|nr:hypothetical protein [Opitutaceae bacterium]